MGHKDAGVRLMAANQLNQGRRHLVLQAVCEPPIRRAAGQMALTLHKRSFYHPIVPR